MDSIIAKNRKLNMSKKVLVHNLDRCLGCKTCQVACFYGKGYQAMVEFEEILGEIVVLPEFCRTCEEAPCVESCPKNALVKLESGQVILKKYHCVGCKSCSFACPFGVIEPKLLTHLPPRCNVCIENTSDVKLPYCVDACPTEAIMLVDEEEAKKEKLFGAHFVGYKPFARRG